MQLDGKPTYRCPHCNQKLSFQEGRHVKMVGRLHSEYFSCKTILYIPATLGQYGAIVGDGVRLRDGAVVEFECLNGACKKSFTAPYDNNLAEIKMVDEGGTEYVVVFSRIFGRRSTILIDQKKKAIVESYGEHAEELAFNLDKRINFFGS